MVQQCDVPKSELSVQKGNECHIECALSGQRCVRALPDAMGAAIVQVKACAKCARLLIVGSLKLVVGPDWRRPATMQATAWPGVRKKPKRTAHAVLVTSACVGVGLNLSGLSCDPAKRVL